MRRPTSIGGARVGVALFTALAIAFAIESSDAAAAPFHDWWLEPSRASAQVGDAIDVSAFVGVSFRGDRVKRDPKRIVRFEALDARGTVAVGEARGDDGAAIADPLGRFVARAEGTTIVAWQSTPVPLYLRAPEFETYLHEEGLEAIVALRAQRGESQKMGLERYSRCAKSLLQVGPETKLRDRPIGLPLELVLEPAKEGDTASTTRCRLTFREQPLVGALVMALERDHPDEVLKLRSDAEGRVSFALPRSGFWLVKAVHMIDLRAESMSETSPARYVQRDERAANVGGTSQGQYDRSGRLDWESFWASLTFERP